MSSDWRDYYDDFNNEQAMAEIEAYERDRAAGKTVEPPTMKPTDVKLHRADGTILNCELADKGVDAEGMHNWEIANAIYQPGDNVTVAVMPPYTGISFRADPTVGTLTGVGIDWTEEDGTKHHGDYGIS